MEATIFYITSFIILVFSVLTVTTKKILRAAVYLLFTLIATSAFYFMVEYHFLAAAQLTIYAGGIVVLIIFSILLTHQINLDLEKINKVKIISSVLTVLFGAILVGNIISNHNFLPSSLQGSDTSINAIGRQLLNYGENGYILPFEVISVLLLAAMIGSIIIVKKTK